MNDCIKTIGRLCAISDPIQLLKVGCVQGLHLLLSVIFTTQTCALDLRISEKHGGAELCKVQIDKIQMIRMK